MGPVIATSALDAGPAHGKGSRGGSSNGTRPAPDQVTEAVRQWDRHGYGALEHMAATASVTRLHQIIVKRIDGELHEFRLTFAQYEALMLLHFSSRGSLPLGQMGRRLMVHPATITGTVDLLEEKGFVRRERDTGDRRQVLAAITRRGRSACEDATKALVDIRFGIGQMTVDEAASIADLIGGVRERMEGEVE